MLCRWRSESELKWCESPAMSSAPLSACTECRTERRAADVRMFPMCHKHRVCKQCLTRLGARAQAAVRKDSCPVCDESRRRVGAQVRTRIWTEEHMKLECVACGLFGPGGALMRCGHAYCMPCLRTQPRSLQSRNTHGDMAKGCHDCETAAAEELRGRARAARERADDEARARRDARELRELREGLRGGLRVAAQAAAAAQARPKKRPAPKRPAPQPLTVPAASSSAENSADDGGVAKPDLAQRQPHPDSTGNKENIPCGGDCSTALDKNKKRVSFDPAVQQRLISPREPRHKRRSLPAVTSASAAGGPSSVPAFFAASAASGLRLHANSSWLHGALAAAASAPSEPRTPVDAHRTFRGWGIASP